MFMVDNPHPQSESFRRRRRRRSKTKSNLWTSVIFPPQRLLLLLVVASSSTLLLPAATAAFYPSVVLLSRHTARGSNISLATSSTAAPTPRFPLRHSRSSTVVLRAATDSPSDENDDDDNNNTENAMKRNESSTAAAPTERDALLLLVEPNHFNVDQDDDQDETEAPIMVDAPQACAAPEDAAAAATAATAALSVTTGQRILQLAIPAAGALLIDPLLTVTDTAFVGRFTDDGAAPLAGMGSAAALLTFGFYLFNFLCTATTPLVAERRAAGDAAGAASVGGQALSLGLALGVALTGLLLALRQPLLAVMGTARTGASGYALQFLTVRALAAPAVLTMEAATGVLRGYLDTVTPVRVLVASNVVNLALDAVLIVGLKLGPLGAAVATTAAEWISAGLFLLVLAGRLPSRVPELGSNRNAVDDSGNGSGNAAVRIVPIARLPPWSEIRSLLVASSSVFFRTLVLQLSLSAAAAVAARSPVDATSSVAAHQIGIQLWLLCSFFCDSLAAASQGLVADALGRGDAKAVVDVANTIFAYSLILGVGLAALLQIGTSTGLLLDIFTQDGTVKDALYSILPLIVVAQPLNSLVFAADGVIQGASEFSFQAVAMIVSGATAVGTFALLEIMASSGDAGSPDTLFNVWVALIALQFMRGLTSLYKLVDAKGPINLLGLEKPI